MPGSPATSPKFGAPRFADTDNATFSTQVNGVTDVFDAEALKTGDDESLASLHLTGAGTALTVDHGVVVSGQLDLTVQGSAGGLLIGGDATLYRNAANSLRTGGALTVDGNATVTGTLTQTGAATFSAAVNANGAGTGLAVQNNATVGGTLTLAGQATLTGGAVVTGALTATTDIAARQGAGTAVRIGAVGPGGASGVTLQNGEAGSNIYRSGAGALTIDGALTVRGALTVTGGVTYTGLLTANGGVASGTVTGAAFSSSQAAGTVILSNTASGDANASFYIRGDGSLHWGPGASVAADTNLYRSAAGVLTTDTVLNAASYRVAGSALAASHLSNGTTGSGAVALAGGPTFSGTLSAATINVTGQYNVNGSQIAAINLANGVTGSAGNAVVLAANPTISSGGMWNGGPTIAGGPTLNGGPIANGGMTVNIGTSSFGLEVHATASSGTYTGHVIMAAMDNAQVGGSSKLFLGQMPAGTNVFYVDSGGVIHSTNTSIASISDRSLKSDIEDLDGGLAAILALRPRSFKWNKDGLNKHAGRIGNRDFGLVAQEVEDVLPHLVSDYDATDKRTLKGLRYGALIPHLVASDQELHAKIVALEARVEKLSKSKSRPKSKESSDAAATSSESR